MVSKPIVPRRVDQPTASRLERIAPLEESDSIESTCCRDNYRAIKKKKKKKKKKQRRLRIRGVKQNDEEVRVIEKRKGYRRNESVGP